MNSSHSVCVCVSYEVLTINHHAYSVPQGLLYIRYLAFPRPQLQVVLNIVDLSILSDATTNIIRVLKCDLRIA